MVERPSRRSYLKAAGVAAITGLAGCTGGSGSGGSGNGGNGSGAGSGGTTGGGGKSIAVWTEQSGPNEREVQNQIISGFENETGHTVDITYAGYDEGARNISQLIQGGNPPEVAHSLMGELIGFRDQLAPMKIMDQIDYFDDIPETAYFSADGEVWTLPFHMYINGVSIREDLLNQVGESLPSDPLEHPTWDDFVRWSRKIDEQTDVRALNVTDGAASGIGGYMFGKPMLWSNGVTVVEGSDSDLNVVLDQNENRKRAIQTLKTTKTLNQYSPDAANWGSGNVIDAFTSGSIAITTQLNPALQIAVAEESNKTVAQNTTFVPQPLGPNGSSHKEGGVSNWTQASSFVSFDSAKNTDVGQEFLAYLYNSDLFWNDWWETRPLHQNQIVPQMIDEEFNSIDFVKNHPRIKDHIDFQVENPDTHRSLIQTADGNFSQKLAIETGQGVLPKMFGLHIHQGVSPGDAVDQTAEEMRNIHSRTDI